MNARNSRALGIPIIETGRLRLRGHTIDDASRVSELWSDPEVTRYIGGSALTREESWARLLRYSGHWELLGFGYWVLEVKATGEFVGEVGFSDYKRDLEPPSKDVPEVGWVLTPAKQGMGYATEAVKAALKWGYRYFGEKPVACLIDPGHEVSIRVAEKCGFKERRTCLYQGKRVLLFERILGR